ncbi:MAG: L,D-transpeptidase [Anaerolineaceae bacterium]|nr:L,D-transpeptidase [Anaerolineaceae bacterium]
MSDKSIRDAKLALENAQKALSKGDRSQTYHWASQAARLAPDEEAPWLILASVASPAASLYYIQKALQINPSSKRARDGMRWAIKRYRIENPQSKKVEPQKPPDLIEDEFSTTISPTQKTVRETKIPGGKPKRKHLFGFLIPISIALIITCLGLAIFFTSPPTITAKAGNNFSARPSDALVKPTLTPTITLTPTATQTSTPTQTPSPTPTFTPTATVTYTPSMTSTPEATSTPQPLPTFTPWGNYDPGSINPGDGDKWIDINLSTQQLFAYVGNDIVNSFVVSTGTWEHPTVTGQYYVYVKYTYTDMAGPGYYLPDVPYTMYFYKGYGIHGTYWHNNFGTPMSHGCVNMRTDEAGWLFNWAYVGILVNIHY